MSKIFRKIRQVLLLSMLSLTLFLVVLEVSYRTFLFDFYKAELNGLNTKETLTSEQPKILVIGDSFSAHPQAYVSLLREHLHEYSVINAGVPGSCIKQHRIYAPKRIRQFDPKIFIYQFYTGNDIFEINHKTSDHNLSFARKFYWQISDKLLGIQFLNFRFAGLLYKMRGDEVGLHKPKATEVFSPDAYSKREKLNYQSDPAHLENTLLLRDGRQKDFEYFKIRFEEMSKLLPASTKKYFIIIPHQSETSAASRQKHQQLGAQFDQPWASTVFAYPLYNELYQMCRELDYEVIDFRLSIEGDSSRIYYENDPHLNYIGQTKLAEQVSYSITK
ncbi:MAG: SGNH/GDSL hydrolase family protein [Saprospiraceae bacterium]|nr:SGNH/GDSL hydrolase family protein [Saprospiraceae bacterium]